MCYKVPLLFCWTNEQWLQLSHAILRNGGFECHAGDEWFAIPHRMRLRPPVSVCLEEWQPTYRQRHRLHSMISWANNAICFVVWAELDTVAAVALFLKCIPLEVTNRCLPPTSSSSKCCMMGRALWCLYSSSLFGIFQSVFPDVHVLDWL